MIRLPGDPEVSQAGPLLPLDHWPQIPDAAQSIHRLLLAAPLLKLLVTSRQTLGLQAGPPLRKP